MTINAQWLFDVATPFSLLGWLLLLVAYFWAGKREGLVLSAQVVGVILCAVFSVGLFYTWNMEPRGDLFSFEGIVTKFSISERLVFNWIEILAYDLLIGTWMVMDAVRRQLPIYWVLLSLLVLWMFGPLGLCFYLAIAAFKHFVGTAQGAKN